jgi:hypothetical protein
MLDSQLTMKDFQQFLTSGNFVSTKKVPFYLHWTRQFLSFCRKGLKDGISNDVIQAFLADLSKHKEKWLVEQAREAIKLYLFFKNRPSKKLRSTGPTKSQWDILVLEAVFRRIYAKFLAEGEGNPVNDMIKISNNPILIPRMPFGKHRGSCSARFQRITLPGFECGVG